MTTPKGDQDTSQVVDNVDVREHDNEDNDSHVAAWCDELFVSLYKLADQNFKRLWKCPACKGEIAWLHSVVTHAKTEGTKAKLHQKLAQLLEEGLRQRGLPRGELGDPKEHKVGNPSNSSGKKKAIARMTTSKEDQVTSQVADDANVDELLSDDDGSYVAASELLGDDFLVERYVDRVYKCARSIKLDSREKWDEFTEACENLIERHSEREAAVRRGYWDEIKRYWYRMIEEVKKADCELAELMEKYSPKQSEHKGGI